MPSLQTREGVRATQERGVGPSSRRTGRTGLVEDSARRSSLSWRRENGLARKIR